MSSFISSVRMLRPIFCALISFFVITVAAAQSSEPSQQRPTLNRHGEPSPQASPSPSSPDQAPAAAPPASPRQEPASGQPGASVEYPRPTYPDLLPHFDYDSHSGLETRETDVQKR